MAVLLLSYISCTEELLNTDGSFPLKSQVDEKKIVNAAESWFNSNPDENNYLLFEFMDHIDWSQAAVFLHDTATVVEVPIKIKSRYLAKVKDVEKLNVEQRLLVVMKSDKTYSLLEFLISNDSKDNLQNIKKINYENLKDSFYGTLVIIDNQEKVVKTKRFSSQTQVIAVNLKSMELHCLCLFEIFSDGSRELVSVLYCYYLDDGSGSSSGGTGSSSTSSECNCNICTVCGGCLDQPQLKSLPYPGDGETEEGSVVCPICSCPKIDISGIEDNDKVLYIFQNLIKTATVEYNPLVTSFLMNFSEDLSVDPDDIIFNLGSLNGAYGECDPSGNKYVITLNSNEINNRAPIEIAKTFIHEILHALIGNKLNRAPGNFVNDFSDYIGANGLNQHQLMMNHYVGPMVNFLKDYDRLSGNVASDSYYRSLALSGLESVISSVEMNALISAQNYFRQRGLSCN